MRIGIFYDNLIAKGGAQRFVIELGKKLNADIITSGYNRDMKLWLNSQIKVIDIGNYTHKISKHLGILIETPIRFFINRHKFKYDINIFCGYTSIFGSCKNKKNIWISFTPNRVLYDLKNEKIKNANILNKLLIYLYISVFYPLDQHIIKNNMKLIIAQNFNIKRRIWKYYKRIAKVIYSFINVNNYFFKQFGDYFLAVSHLTPEKRMDMITKAFLQIPNKKLVLVGDGPDKSKIINLINGHKHIMLLSDIKEKVLRSLYSNCLATLYFPKDEDFGLVPLESMASGKPCIAANEGGCKETIIHNRTGFLIKPSENSIIKIVNMININKCKLMKKKCINRARKFDIEKYIYKINFLLESL